ncbi:MULTISPECIES: hypothetical protein [Streptomyces]|uniref:hypothetical protein n=1 Tax=Streptomyces lycopersici TaxID=2974589 RepID=UPI0021CDF89B|nr:hypothetical protein [Streptomyces sp. NEAU-383]
MLVRRQPEDFHALGTQSPTPREHYALTVKASELSDVEANAAAATSADDIALDLP